MRQIRYWFKVYQDGVEVAGGDAPTQAIRDCEAAHYVMMYGQDGPTKVKKGCYRASLARSRDGDDGKALEPVAPGSLP